MSGKGFFQFRIYDQDKKRLAAIAEVAGISEAAVIRELLPPVPVMEAFSCRLLAAGQDGCGIAAEIFNAAISVLVREMVEDPEYSVELQLEAVRGRHKKFLLADPDMFVVGASESELYKTWVRAKAGVDGFRIEEIRPGESVALSPEDDPEYVSWIKRSVLQLWEKRNEPAGCVPG